MQRANVPCGSCRACCRNNLIMLFPDEGDDVASYQHDIVTLPEGTGAVLKHKPNGDCIYLEENGCSIHKRAPVICKVFDCRAQYKMLTRKERRRRVALGLFRKDILDAGRERLDTL